MRCWEKVPMRFESLAQSAVSGVGCALNQVVAFLSMIQQAQNIEPTGTGAGLPPRHRDVRICLTSL
jgi:hypothetical protein